MTEVNDKKIKVNVYLTLFKPLEVTLKENYTNEDLRVITKSLLNLNKGEDFHDWKIDDVYVTQQ